MWLRRMENGEESEGHKRRSEAKAKLMEQQEEEAARLYLKAQRTKDPTQSKAVHEEYLVVVRKFLPAQDNGTETEYQEDTEAGVDEAAQRIL